MRTHCLSLMAVTTVVLLSTSPMWAGLRLDPTPDAVRVASPTPADTSTPGQAPPVPGQSARPTQLVSVPFSDPNRPGKVTVHVIDGSVTVRAENRKDVAIEASADAPEPSRDRRRTNDRGLRRIPNPSTDLTVDEDNNDMRVLVPPRGHSTALTLRVPTNTSLNLSVINGGDIVVEGVNGSLEASNINGGVILRGVGGTVVAHALNDDLTVAMSRVDPKTPMSFSSLNGAIDVTLPAATQATLRLETSRGDAWTDFDVQLQSSPAPTVERDGRRGGYRARTSRGMVGAINGGGPEFTFKTVNGDIRVRKGP